MNIGYQILIIGGSIGILSSLLTLWIIFRMGRINGYIKLLLILTISQLLYDISIVLVIWKLLIISYIYLALRSISGLCVTFITNVLSFVVVYTVYTSKVIDLAKNIRYILLFIFVPSIVYGILVPYAIFNFSDSNVNIISSIYYWTRVASIIFNISCYFSMIIKLNQIDIKWFTTQSNSDTNTKQQVKSPLWALAHRFKYYPIVQILTRLPVAIHEYNYGHDYDYPSDGSIRDKISLLLYVLALPAAGLGYFLVFITVCPGAFKQFQTDLKILIYFLSFQFLCEPLFYQKFLKKFQNESMLTDTHLSCTSDSNQLQLSYGKRNLNVDDDQRRKSQQSSSTPTKKNYTVSNNDTISQLFSSRLSYQSEGDDYRGSEFDESPLSTPPFSGTNNANINNKNNNSTYEIRRPDYDRNSIIRDSYRASESDYPEYRYWNEEELIAEIGRLYSSSAD